MAKLREFLNSMTPPISWRSWWKQDQDQVSQQDPKNCFSIIFYPFFHGETVSIQFPSMVLMAKFLARIPPSASLRWTTSSSSADLGPPLEAPFLKNRKPKTIQNLWSKNSETTVDSARKLFPQRKRWIRLDMGKRSVDRMLLRSLTCGSNQRSWKSGDGEFAASQILPPTWLAGRSRIYGFDMIRSSQQPLKASNSPCKPPMIFREEPIKKSPMVGNGPFTGPGFSGFSHEFDWKNHLGMRDFPWISIRFGINDGFSMIVFCK